MGAIVLSLGLLLVSAAALSGALMLTRHARLRRELRLGLVAAPETRAGGIEGFLKSGSRRLDRRLRQMFTAGHGRIWGMRHGAAGLMAVALGTAAASSALLHMAVGLSQWIVLPASLAAGYLLPRALLIRQQKAAERQFTDLFPDATDAIARMLRAGLPITAAIRALATEAPAPVNEVFAEVAAQIALGTPIEDALDASSRDVGLPDYRFFTVAVVLQHATGGNLAATLETLSDIVRKRRAVRMKARATTAEIRVSGYLLGAIPFLIAGLLMLIQPGYLTPLFADPRGQMILAIAAGLMLLAGVTMRQMMRSVTNL